jgi:hypothetical protein
MAKAIAYGTKRWLALCRFLDDGRLEIDNNIAERVLRGVAVGRRTWLFAGSKTGGERAAAIYTVIRTCKANGVAPQAYIADVTGKIAADWPAAGWDELMPWELGPTACEAGSTSCIVPGLPATLTFLIQPEGEFPAFIWPPLWPLQQHIRPASSSQAMCEDGSRYSPVTRPRSWLGRRRWTGTNARSGTRREGGR